MLLLACALFGFSVGNLITLPALIVQREFDPRSFGVLISLITAINQVTYAFGPGVIGLLRDASGSYTLPFYGCIALQLMAAVLIMVRGRKKRSPDGAKRIRNPSRRAGSDGARSSGLRGHASRSRNRSSRSSRLVNIASEPSGLRGHSASAGRGTVRRRCGRDRADTAPR